MTYSVPQGLNPNETWSWFTRAFGDVGVVTFGAREAGLARLRPHPQTRAKLHQ